MPEARHVRTREKIREMLGAGELEDRKVEINVEQRQAPVQVFSNMGMEQMDVDLQNMFEKLMPKQQQERHLTIAEARKFLIEQEAEALMDNDVIHQESIELAEQTGMVFVDEIDKICGPEEGSKSADVSRQGVQRDLLPIIEGTTVQTRYGNVSTEHMLFIAAGAFHRSRPSDLMPELQGRFPIRVELTDLTRDDLLRILTEPTSSISQQYQALLKTDGVKVEYTQDGLEAIADIAWKVNQSTQNIGARRLHTILEHLLEEVSFRRPRHEGTNRHGERGLRQRQARQGDAAGGFVEVYSVKGRTGIHSVPRAGSLPVPRWRFLKLHCAWFPEEITPARSAREGMNHALVKSLAGASGWRACMQLLAESAPSKLAVPVRNGLKSVPLSTMSVAEGSSRG